MSAGGSISLSALPQGALIGIAESGIVKPFILAKHDYPAAGNGRTLLLRKYLHSSRPWASAEKKYDTCDIGVWLDETYIDYLDADIRVLIVAVDLPMDSSGSLTYSKKVFLLSGTEVGMVQQNIKIEGVDLGLFADNAARIAYLESAPTVAKPWWSRTQSHINISTAWAVTNTGTYDHLFKNSKMQCVRPAFVLPNDMRVKPKPAPEGYYLLIGG